MQTINIFWFRRDLRLFDNTGLQEAMKKRYGVLALFIFDKKILDTLPTEDKRVDFIHFQVSKIKSELEGLGSSLLVLQGNPLEIFQELLETYPVMEVFANQDYEPYSILRDNEIESYLASRNIKFSTYKDQVIFEKAEIVKKDGTPYTVFTPYSKKWIEMFNTAKPVTSKLTAYNFLQTNSFHLPGLKELGFTKTSYKPAVPRIDKDIIRNYDRNRDFPGLQGTSGLGIHLRFGTLSIRELVLLADELNPVFLNELIWREFFMSILFHYPHVQHHSFRQQYDRIEWRNNTTEFDCWCMGETGYPIVDAGMRELNATGFMHNRVRMITASFLCKDLLIDWRWGEAFFAEKLLDYELASNNGNWQWAAGTGCDAAPYFRIFNPMKQARKFDPDYLYIKKWVPEFKSPDYARPIVDHSFARSRTLSAYKKASLV